MLEERGLMSELIPSITWIDFLKVVKLRRLGELKSCEVTFNGEHLFTAIISHGDVIASDYIRTQAEYLGVKSNISEGKNPEEILRDELPERQARLRKVLSDAPV